MSLISRLLGSSEGKIEGTGNNLQEALDDYAQKVKSLDPNREIISIEVGDVDENGKETPWFTLNFKGR